MADDVKISIGANTENFQVGIEKAFKTLNNFGIKNQDLGRQVDKAYKELASVAAKMADDVQGSFNSLNVKSDASMKAFGEVISRQSKAAIADFNAITESMDSTANDIQRAAGKIREIFAGLDASVLKEEFRTLGIQSSSSIEEMKIKAINAFNEIKINGEMTPRDITRAHEAMTAEITRLDSLLVTSAEKAAAEKIAIEAKANSEREISINKLRAASVNAEVQSILAAEKAAAQKVLADKEAIVQINIAHEQALRMDEERDAAMVISRELALRKMTLAHGEAAKLNALYDKGLVDGTGEAIKGINGMTHGMSGFSLASVAAIAKVQIMYSLINQVMSTIGSAPGIAAKAIEDFNSAAITNSALITSMQSKTKDVGKQYQDNKVYALAVQEVLVKMDAETSASAQNLSDMNRAFIAQGVILDVNNKKQIEGFKNTANAIEALTHGNANQQMQYTQEVKSMLKGEDKAGNQLFQALNGMDNGKLKEHLAEWQKIAKETGNYGYVLEKIGPMLQGFAAAQGDINNLWSTTKSTMATIRDEILRGGLSGAFQEIIDKMKDVQQWAEKNKLAIQEFLKDGFKDAQIAANLVWNLAKGVAYFGEPIKYGAIVIGFALITKAIQGINIALLATPIGKINALVGLGAAAVTWAGNKYFDYKDEGLRIADIKASAVGSKTAVSREEIERNQANVKNLDGPTLDILTKRFGKDDALIAKMFEYRGVSIQKNYDKFGNELNNKVIFNEKKIAAILADSGAYVKPPTGLNIGGKDEKEGNGEAQGHYNAEVLAARAALEKQNFENVKRIEKVRLEEQLNLIKYEQEVGLKTVQEGLDAKYEAEKTFYGKELIAAKEYVQSRKSVLDAINKMPDPGMGKGKPEADLVMQLEAEQKLAEAVGKEIEISEKLNKASLQYGIEFAKNKENQQKLVLTFAEQLEAQMSNTVAATAFRQEIEKQSSAYKQLEKDGGSLFALKQKLMEIDRLKAKQDQEMNLASMVNKNLNDEANLKATQSKLNFNPLQTKFGFGAIDDQTAAEKLAIQTKYEMERQAIQNKIDLIKSASEAELIQIDAIHKANMAAIETENKVRYFDNPAKLAKATQAQVSAEKEYSDKISKIKIESAKNSTEILSALTKAFSLTFKKQKQEEVTAEQKATQAKFSLASEYTSMVGNMFTALAGTMDQSSRSGFESAKALNLAAAVVSTAAAIMNQMAGGDPYTAWARAAAAGAMGIIQIATIASTSFGGGGSITTPTSGSFASSGGGSTGSGAGSAVSAPIMSVNDSQSAQQLDKVARSMDNAALAMGKASQNFLKISEMFKADVVTMLMQIAPGRYTNTPADMSGVGSNIANTIGISKDSIKNFFSGTLALAKFDIGKAFSNVSSVFNNTMRGLFGGGWGVSGAGITSQLQNGQFNIGSYTSEHKNGGLFGNSGDRTYYGNNVDPAFAKGMQQFFSGLKTDILRGAAAFGMGAVSTEAGFAGANTKLTQIATAGRKPEDIQKDWEVQVQAASDALVKTIPGLKELSLGGELATATLERLSSAMLNVTDNLALIGAKLIPTTGNITDTAYRLQSLMGGADKFASKVDKYFTTMFTDTEQEAMKVAQAQRQVNLAFAEMNLTVPATKAGFVKLVDGLDVSTESGAKLFAALMDISEAFGLTQKAVEKTQTTLNDSAKTAIDVAINAANALKEIMGGTLSTKSPEQIYFERQATFAAALANGRSSEIPDLGKALLEASRQYNASGAGYVADYASVTKAIGDVAGIKGETRTITIAEKQVQLLEDIKKGFEEGKYALVASMAGGLATGSAISTAVNTATQAAGAYDPAADYSTALKMAVGIIPADMKYDLNKDGAVTIADALGYLRLSKGLPAYASGGFHSGGLRIVGENGPELEATGSSRIWNADQTRGILSNGSADNRNEEIALLREQVKHLAALVRVSQAGHIGTIEAIESGNANGKVLSNKINLANAA